MVRTPYPRVDPDCRGRTDMRFHDPSGKFRNASPDIFYFGSPDLTPPGLQKVSISPRPGDSHTFVDILVYS